MSADVKSSTALRARARGLLCKAYDEGRLQSALNKWAGDDQKEKVAAGASAEEVSYSLTLSLGSAASPSSSNGAATATKKKKKRHDLAAALALGEMQTDPNYEPTLEERKQAVHVDGRRNIGGMSPGGHHQRPDYDTADARAAVAKKLEDDQEAIKKKLSTKFGEAERLAQKKKVAAELHHKRLEFIEFKLKFLLETMVAKVSEKEAGRPDNPVPLMIEVLAEIIGKSPASFGMCSPAARIRREISELKKEVAFMEEMYENGDRFTDGSDGSEGEVPDDE